MDALPALVFHFDRHGIECLAKDLLMSLGSAENTWKSNNTRWQEKVQNWNKWQAQVKTRQRRENAPVKLSFSKAIEEELRDSEPSWLDAFDPLKPLSQFSFQSTQSKVVGEELERQIANLVKWNDIPDWVGGCLRRGIGIHHSSLNRRLRQLVRSLFRAGTLRVVIATG